eukprot:1444106-Pyramimonas_sp.AAC.1
MPGSARRLSPHRRYSNLATLQSVLFSETQNWRIGEILARLAIVSPTCSSALEWRGARHGLTVELTVKTLLSRLVTQKINFPAFFYGRRTL